MKVKLISRETKGLVRDPQLDTAYKDLEDLRNKIQQATEKIFNVGVYITIYADSLEDLDKAEQDMRALLEGKLIFIKPTLFQQEKGFSSTSPLSTDLLQIHTKLNSDPLSSMFPFIFFRFICRKRYFIWN